jgi:hypothetical protein
MRRRKKKKRKRKRKRKRKKRKARPINYTATPPLEEAEWKRQQKYSICQKSLELLELGHQVRKRREEVLLRQNNTKSTAKKESSEFSNDKPEEEVRVTAGEDFDKRGKVREEDRRPRDDKGIIDSIGGHRTCTEEERSERAGDSLHSEMKSSPEDNGQSAASLGVVSDCQGQEPTGASAAQEKR